MENSLVTVPLDYVAIPVDVYSNLQSDSDLLTMLIDGLMNASSLCYSGEYLLFDDGAIRTLLKASPYAHRYRNKLRKLQEEKEEMLNGTGTDID